MHSMLGGTCKPEPTQCMCYQLLTFLPLAPPSGAANASTVHNQVLQTHNRRNFRFGLHPHSHTFYNAAGFLTDHFPAATKVRAYSINMHDGCRHLARDQNTAARLNTPAVVLQLMCAFIMPAGDLAL